MAKLAQRSVEIRHECGEFHVERSDGQISVAIDPRQAISLVAKDNRRMARQPGVPGVIAVVNWTNTPAGFIPPSE